MSAMPIYAQQAAVGEPELNLVKILLTGNIGFALGLLIAIWGVFTLSAGQNTTFGIALIILGVLITLTPGIYNGTRMVVCPIIKILAPGAVC